MISARRVRCFMGSVPAFCVANKGTGAAYFSLFCKYCMRKEMKGKGECSMKATGIVRRIDDLGRVVIPKEIRRTQRIRQGDPLEIFTNTDGEVIFKKYSPMGELSAYAQEYAEVLTKSFALPAIVCDRDHILAAAGPGKRELADRRVSQPLERLMENRRSYAHSGKNGEAVYPCEGAGYHVLAAAPILVAGDVAGAVALLGQERADLPTEAQTKAAMVAALYLARQLEA